MTLRPFLALLGLGLLTASASAQLHTVVGPPAVPLGGDLSVTFSNDYPHKFGISTGLWRILDDTGTEVYSAGGASSAILMASGGWYTFHWNLRDQQGILVPAGNYDLKVQYDNGAPIDTFPFSVVPTGTGLVFEGRATTQPPFISGPARNFYLTSPSDAGMPYLLLASTSSVAGTPTCGGTVPLDATPLLIQSLTPGLIFQNSFGTLNPAGASTAPRFPLPNVPALVGLQVHAAFLVLDLNSPCIVRSISNVHSMTLL
jgi:hypothetical protein